MKKLLPGIFVSFLLAACGGHAITRFYPVQGPLAAQTPPPIYVGKVSGWANSGTIVLTGNQGEVFHGRWETIEQPKKSTDAPGAAAGDSEMKPLWDSIYGNGFYVAHVLGSKMYARATMAGANGDSLRVEFYREDRNDRDANALRAAIKGVAKDEKGNVYKITVS